MQIINLLRSMGLGLDINGIKFLLYSQNQGSDFTRTAMIGRQNLGLRPSDLKRSFTQFGFSFTEKIIREIYSCGPYAERFFQSIGAKKVDSFDFSDYEGSSHVHDMNLDIPDQFNEQYSVVCDSGSLEHVFNFPMALKNCMKMVEVGGYYLGISPANNFMGHGFYQFSPELYYSVFTPANGFELVRLIAFEDNPLAKWYSVKNPASVGGRVTMTSTKQVYLLVLAKRIAKITPFESTPQQSDFVVAWNSKSDSGVKNLPGQLVKQSGIETLFNKMNDKAPHWLKNIVKKLILFHVWRAGFSAKFFQPFNPAEGIKSSKKLV